MRRPLLIAAALAAFALLGGCHTAAGWSGGVNQPMPVVGQVNPPEPPANPVNNFTLSTDSAEVTAATATVYSNIDDLANTALSDHVLADHGLVTAGPTFRDTINSDGAWYWFVDFTAGDDGWISDGEVRLYTPLPPGAGTPNNSFSLGNSVWRKLASTGGQVRSTPGGTLLGIEPVQITGTILARGGASCSSTSGEACKQQIGGAGNQIWWWNVQFPTLTGWINDDDLELAAAPAGNTFAINDAVRKDDDGTTTPLQATPGGSTVATLQSGAYCVVTAAPSYVAAWYWPVNCLNVGDGYVLDSKLEATTAPPTILSIGQAIINITGTTNVRSTPAGSVAGTQAINAPGTILDGPRYATGVTGSSNWWYQVNFTSGTDGWVVAERLQSAAAAPPDIVPPAASATTTITGLALSGGTGAAASLGNCISAAATGTETAPIVTRCIMPAGNISHGSSVSYTIPVGKTIIVDNEVNNGTIVNTASVGLTFQGSGYEANQTPTSLDTVSGKTRVCFASLPSGWKADDIIKIIDLNTPLPGIRFTTTNNHRLGELMQIASVTSTCATFTEAMAQQSLYTGPLRAARLRSGQVWIMGLRITGSEAFDVAGSPMLTLTSLIAPRTVRRYERSAATRFMYINNTWRGIDYEMDTAFGTTDTSHGASDGIDAHANKYLLVAASGTKTNCTDHSNCFDADDNGAPANSGTMTQYGYDMFTTVRLLIAREMRNTNGAGRVATTHSGAYGTYFDRVEDHQSVATNYGMTYRGKAVTMDGILIDRPNGTGIQACYNDGLCGSLLVKNARLNVASHAGDLNTSFALPGSTFTVQDSTCQATMTTNWTKTNSPGC